MIKRFLQDTSIRLRIAIIIFFVLLPGLFLLSSLLGKILERDFKKVLSEYQLATTSMVALHINAELIRRTQALQNITHSISQLPKLDQIAIKNFLEQYQFIYALFSGGIFSCEFPDDSKVHESEPVPACQDFLQNKALITIIKKGRPSIGELIGQNNNQQLSFLIAVPTYDDRGQVSGMLVGVNDLSKEDILGTWTESIYGSAGEYLVIAPVSGIVISATNDAHLLQKIDSLNAHVLREQIDQGFEGMTVIDTFSTIVSILSVKKIDVSGWSVVSILPVSEAFAPIVDLNHFLHLGVLILTLIVIFIIWGTLKVQLSPLITTVKDIDDIAHNRKPFASLRVKSQDEVGRLIASFNKLLKKLEDREDQLHEGEIFSHAILNSVPVEIAVLDQYGTIIKVNQPWLQFEEKYGDERAVRDTGNAVGANYLDVCRRSIEANKNQDAFLVLDGIKAVLEGRLPSFSLEYKCVSPTQRYWFSLAVTPLNHHNNGAVVSHIDITQRKHIEEALHVAWASAQAALDAIFWLDQDAKIVDVNLAACKLLGYDEATILQLHLADVSPDTLFDQKRWRQYFSKNKQDGAIRVETKLRGRCGRTIAVDVNSIYIQHEGKELICAFVRDITERKRNEVALRQAKAEAERANNAKSKFLAAASHDLRQPLSALSLYVDLLSQYKQPRIMNVVGNIQGCVESMSELLSDLLDISKLEAGVVHPNNAHFLVDEMLQKLVNIFKAESNVKKLSLRFRPSRLIAHSDQKLLFRIIGNLISNAIRYTKKGGILIACRRHKNKYYVEVFDTGIGIQDDQLELIFEEFRQLEDNSRNRGSGLGLAIVKKMATLMGLEIVVKSRVGRGSLFRVEIPVVADAVLYHDFVVEPSPPGALIAVVDDNVEILKALKLTLEGIGYEVIAGTSGHSVQLDLEGRIPNLLISDFRLQKGENGFEVIGAFRQEFGQDLPAILITGDTDPHLIRAMKDRGIVTLFKPLQFKKLKALIATILETGNYEDHSTRS